MGTDKKQKLFPYFAYIYSKEMNPSKYSSTTSIEEWATALQNSEEDMKRIIEAAVKLKDSDWDTLERTYSQVTTDFMKKGGKAKKSKKCSCGCDLLLAKGIGGKLTTKCACNCNGGKMKK